MQGPKDVSLHFKIMLTVLLLTLTVSSLAIAVFINNDLVQYRKLASLFNKITNQTSSISSAILDNNLAAANNDLNNLRINLDIATADIFFYQGKNLVRFSPIDSPRSNSTAWPAPSNKSIYSYFDKNLELIYPVLKQGKTIGAIYIQTKNDNEYLYSLIAIMVLITILAIIAATYLGEYITRPLSSFIEAMKNVAKNDYSIRIKKNSNDEIGNLVDNFNVMLDKIQMNNKVLIKTSRMAGMAEVSTSILHNIGNVLNSVNVTSKILHSSVEELKIEEFEYLATLLKDNANELGPFFSSNEKGKRIIGYLTKMTDYLKKEQQSLLTELESLHKNIDHIKSVITTQQSLSRVKSIIEQVLLSNVVKDVLAIHKTSLTTYNILYEYHDTTKAQVSIDRCNVEQILINLVRNAIDALITCPKKDKLINLYTSIDEKNNIIIQVSDNGEGIAQENLTSIFNFGFTTKIDGHGFGLHSAALAAKEMGGELLVESAGLNEGATFTLKIPAQHNALVNNEETYET